MKRVSAKFVARLLTEDKKNRLNVCYELREQVGSDPQILSKVVTGDETWCYRYDPETKQASDQWKTPNSYIVLSERYVLVTLNITYSVTAVVRRFPFV